MTPPEAREDAQQMNALFAQVKSRFEARKRSGLVCKQGYYIDCWVLKLQKASWTNDPMHQIANQSGIFFSVWGNGESLKENRVLYNIHALKLRLLKGYAITGRNFASDFRERFKAVRGEWPNVRLDYGPATLMQGWIAGEPDVLSKDILTLMDRFVRLSPVIDDLLAARRT